MAKKYTINPEDEEITITKFDEKDDNSISPNKMLTFLIRVTNTLGIFYKM